MDLVSKLKADLAKGFSKVQLEKCIGLPQNSLSGIIAGTKEISKISALKIEQWEQSKKPDPLTLVVPKKKKVAIQDLTKRTNIIEPKKPAGSEESNYVIDTSKFDKNDPLKLMEFGAAIEKGSALDGFVDRLPQENEHSVVKAKNISAVSGEPVKINITEDSHVPQRKPGESSIDFRVRKIEWEEQRLKAQQKSQK